jgi:hypothetical protein
MQKLIIILVVSVLSVAFAYGQTVDTTAAKDSAQVVAASAAPAASTGEKKTVTGVRTSKPATNWSKIKDLFL